MCGVCFAIHQLSAYPMDTKLYSLGLAYNIDYYIDCCLKCQVFSPELNVVDYDGRKSVKNLRQWNQPQQKNERRERQRRGCGRVQLYTWLEKPAKQEGGSLWVNKGGSLWVNECSTMYFVDLILHSIINI
uniref:Uncharacterized protein n=1 Tax=Cacopsylla melanoneura TaxID=428564 RepID=A0A8D8W0B6_9HEMI